MIGITERGDAALSLDWIPWVKEGKPAILITKDIKKLDVILFEEELYENKNYIIHCTITGYGGTILEPNVINAKDALCWYLSNVNRLGKNRVVLRIDPIIPTIKGIETAKKIISEAKSRVRISFLDNYKHVQTRFKEANLPIIYNREMHAPLELRKSVLKELEGICGHSIEVCGEPGMSCSGCISQMDLNVLGIKNDGNISGKQRPACACLSLKQELLNNKKQCGHRCLYCYWK